jgi:hypothetical protein
MYQLVVEVDYFFSAGAAAGAAASAAGAGVVAAAAESVVAGAASGAGVASAAGASVVASVAGASVVASLPLLPQDAAKRPNVSANTLNFTIFILFRFCLLYTFIPVSIKGNPFPKNIFI